MPRIWRIDTGCDKGQNRARNNSVGRLASRPGTRSYQALIGIEGTSAALSMSIREMKKARSGMRLFGGIIVLAATLGAVKLWTSDATGGWISTGAMIGAGLGVFVFA